MDPTPGFLVDLEVYPNPSLHDSDLVMYWVWQRPKVDYVAMYWDDTNHNDTGKHLLNAYYVLDLL